MVEIAAFTLKGGQTFPEGTSVGAYPRTAWPSYQPPSGAPSGAATSSGTITNNQVTFTGLSDNTQYVAYASTPDRYKSFFTATSPTAGRNRGAWQANTAYSQGDLVTQGGVLYSANADFTSGGSFSAANWTQVGLASTITPLTSDVGPITAQTTLQNITGLGVSLGASATEIWLVKYWLLVDAANATMDLKVGFTGPVGAALQWGPLIGGNNALNGWYGGVTTNSPLGLNNLAATQGIGTVAGVIGVPLVAVAFSGGTAGTLQIQYAQATSDAGALKIAKGSLVEATKVAA